MDINVGKTDCKVLEHSWRYWDDDIYNMFITDITSKPFTFNSLNIQQVRVSYVDHLHLQHQIKYISFKFFYLVWEVWWVTLDTDTNHKDEMCQVSDVHRLKDWGKEQRRKSAHKWKTTRFRDYHRIFYHSLHFSGLFILASAGQENCFWKSSELPSGPMTLNLPGLWGSLNTCPRRLSGVWISHQTWA